MCSLHTSISCMTLETPTSQSRSKNNPPKILRFVILITLLLCADLSLHHSPACALHPLRIGTGGQTGVYYPIGTLIAEGLTRQAALTSSALKDVIAVAHISAGSLENVRKIAAGELEAGLVQADVASFAIQGAAPFLPEEGSLPIRALASLYPEKFQFVVRSNAGINHFKDIRGKRISIDEEGSGSLAIMRIVLREHGITENDFQPVYLKPAFTEGKLRSGHLHGFSLMAGAPMEAVTTLGDLGVTLVPLDPSIASGIHEKYPYLVPGTIKAGTYPAIPEIITIEVYALLVVHERMDTDMAYGMTAALFSEETTNLLRQGHPLGGSITPATALNGLSIPLHPGAEQFYRDHKLLGNHPR